MLPIPLRHVGIAEDSRTSFGRYEKEDFNYRQQTGGNLLSEIM